jgi:hypothetical protein
MWGFFLNYPRLSKGFRKIQYAMQCILGKINLEKIFLCRVNSLCYLYALLCWKIFILTKSRCYRY